MSFTLRIDADKWREHLRAVTNVLTAATGNAPVPVIKGNGYGLGQELVAKEAMDLGADTIAVGTVFEIESIVNITYSGFENCCGVVGPAVAAMSGS